MPSNLLDQINAQLDAMTSSLQQYEANGQQAYLDQAHSYADALLVQVVQLAPGATSDGAQDLQSAVSTFRRSAGQHLRNIEEEVGELSEKVAEAKQELEAQHSKIEKQDTRLDSVVSDFQAQFSSAEEQRRIEAGQAIEEARGQLRSRSRRRPYKRPSSRHRPSLASCLSGQRRRVTRH